MTLTRLAWPTIHLSSGHFLGRHRRDSYHISGRQQAHTHTAGTPGATEVQGLGWKARDSEAARSSPRVLRSALRCPHPSCNLECRAIPPPLSRDPRALSCDQVCIVTVSSSTSSSRGGVSEGFLGALRCGCAVEA